MKRRMVEQEVEDLNRHLAGSRNKCNILQRQFEDTNNRLRVANLDIRCLEAENTSLRAYEEEYRRIQDEFIKINASREIHIGWVEGQLQEYKSRVTNLYDQKLQAEALVAEVRHQGFLPTTNRSSAE